MYANSPVYNHPVLFHTSTSPQSDGYEVASGELLTSRTVSRVTTQEEPDSNTSGFSIGHTCITGARVLGANVPKGDAIDLPVSGPPVSGGVVKLKYGEGVYGHHIAVIQAVLPKGLYIAEYNYKEDGQYGERFIPYSDPAIIGFWSE